MPDDEMRSLDEMRADLDKLMKKLDEAHRKMGEALFMPDGDIRDRHGFLKTWTF